MKYLFAAGLGFLALTVLGSAEDVAAGEKAMAQSSTAQYAPKDYSHLLGMPGFSDQLLNMHFQLYQGYVKNTNLLLNTLKDMLAAGKTSSYEYAALKRRVGWEFDGMRLHEFYFDNLGGHSLIDDGSPLAKQLFFIKEKKS